VNEHRESQTTGTGGRRVPDGRAAIAARGIGSGFFGLGAFGGSVASRTALRVQLEHLRPRPLKVQSARPGRP
jgi:hypothetical protein